MDTDVWVLGGYQSDFARNLSKEGLDFADLTREIVDATLSAAKLDAADIGVVHVANAFGEMFAEQGHLGAMPATVCDGLWDTPASRHEAACASGSIAALAAMADLRAGNYDAALVLGVELEKTVPGDTAARHLGAAAWTGHEGADAKFLWPSMFATVADEYERRYGIDETHLRAIAQVNFGNARRNPNAQTREWTVPDPIGDNDATNPSIEGRLRRFDCSQMTDGGAGVVLVTDTYLRDHPTARPIARIAGWGHRTVGLGLQQKLDRAADDPYVMPHVRAAVLDALRRAQANLDDLHGFEVHDCFTPSEYLAIDHIGLTGPGESWKAIENGEIGIRGRLPINPSGGLIGGGHPVGASGVRMLVDAAKQVSGAAGDYQIENAKTFGTLNFGGSTATTVSFVVNATQDPDMDVEVVGKYLSTLPEDDDHPYRTGPWRPQTSEWDADDLVAVEGEIPRDLDGVYLRNTENPLHPALKTYHPFDGDGMLHIVGFRDGKAFYRNRFVRTDGFLAENEAGEPLWPGLAEPVQLAKRDGGCGARTRMKDASSTDVIVHRGVALTSFYQCGDLYRVDPFSANTLGKESWNGRFPVDWGVSAHPKVDPKSGELLFFNYSKQAPYMHYGVVDESNELTHYVDIPLPGPRLPHDMAFTENYVILNDFPLFWDPSLLEHDVHLPRFYPDMPSRFAVVPRRGSSNDIRWFEADPTFVLHFTNAYEEGDEIVLDGFYEGAPQPLDTGGNNYDKLFRFLALDRLQARLHRWRFNLVTGEAKEEQLSESITEFGTINPDYAAASYRYAYAATGKPGWFLFDGLVKHDLRTGGEQHYQFAEGVYGSEAAMAPRPNPTSEDDGYLITLTTDMDADASYCVIFDAARFSDGPVCKLALPERVSSGTHATWAAGAQLRRWHDVDSLATAIGL